MIDVKLSINDIKLFMDKLLVECLHFTKHNEYYIYITDGKFKNIYEIQLLTWTVDIQCKIIFDNNDKENIYIREFKDIYELEPTLNIKLTDEMITQALVEVL